MCGHVALESVTAVYGVRTERAAQQFALVVSPHVAAEVGLHVEGPLAVRTVVAAVFGVRLQVLPQVGPLRGGVAAAGVRAAVQVPWRGYGGGQAGRGRMGGAPTPAVV